MIGWAAVEYLFAPFGLWKTQRKKIVELQGRAQNRATRNSHATIRSYPIILLSVIGRSRTRFPVA